MSHIVLPCNPPLHPTLMCYEKAPMYYRGANAALLLYDITNAATFESVRGWLEGTPIHLHHARSNRVIELAEC